MRLTIPDDLADALLELMPVGAKAPLLEDTVVRVLRQALPLVREGGLALSRDDLYDLSEILLRPSIGSARDLIAATRDLNSLSIGRHQLKLPAATLKGLQQRAAREGQKFDVLLQSVVERLGQEVGGFV